MRNDKDENHKRAHDTARQWAQRQGLIIVQASKRRYTVVQVDSTSTIRPDGIGRYFTYMTGTTVFGPDSWHKCLDFIAQAGLPLPAEIPELLA